MNYLFKLCLFSVLTFFFPLSALYADHHMSKFGTRKEARDLLDRTIKVTYIFIKNTISELANWAYPLYLMHILIIDLVKNLNIQSLLINILLILFINLFTALIIRKYIELPFISIRPKYLS